MHELFSRWLNINPWICGINSNSAFCCNDSDHANKKASRWGNWKIEKARSVDLYRFWMIKKNIMTLYFSRKLSECTPPFSTFETWWNEENTFCMFRKTCLWYSCKSNKSQLQNHLFNNYLTVNKLEHRTFRFNVLKMSL